MHALFHRMMESWFGKRRTWQFQHFTSMFVAVRLLCMTGLLQRRVDATMTETFTREFSTGVRESGKLRHAEGESIADRKHFKLILHRGTNRFSIS